MSSIRNKTVRRMGTHDLSGTDYSLNAPLESMLQSEAGQAYRKPWHRLERGLRLNRLRSFVETLSTTRGLNQKESTALLQLLVKALDKKLLNSKTSILYDPEKEEITEIKPLVMHQDSQGQVLFQILEPRKAVTFRRRSEETPAPSN